MILKRPLGRGLLLALLTSFSSIVIASNEIPVDNAMAQDSAAYSRDMGVSLDEAENRLSIQRDIGNLHAMLALDNHENYAGLYVEHTPVYKIFVLFKNLKGNKNKNFTGYLNRKLAQSPWRSYVKIRKVENSLNDLKTLQMDVAELIEQLGQTGSNPELSLNTEKNKIEIRTLNKAELEFSFSNAGLSLPASVEIVEVIELSSNPEAADIFGGLGIVANCTTGFSVENIITGERGISTAGHCSFPAIFENEEIPLKAELEVLHYDIQWHSADAANKTVDNYVRTCSFFGATCGRREIIGVIPRQYQFIGEYVCKFGEVTGETCGIITDTFYSSYKPAADGSKPEYSFKHVYVSSLGSNLSSEGDSGGPWYSGNYAYGSHTTGPGLDSTYMAADDFSVLGIKILTE